MLILDKRISKEELVHIEEKTFFEYMMKCVVDIDRDLIAVNAELHAELESFLLENGSKQEALYGINILYDDWSIEYDSLINPPRNRDAGYPRVGRYVADPAARESIERIVKKWMEI